MAYVIVVALLVGVVAIVSSPWRRRYGAPGVEAPDPAPLADSEVVELEAARDAKYREIRDTELDHDTGKLSDADYAAIESTLRAEAIEILRQLDLANGVGGEAVAADPRRD